MLVCVRVRTWEALARWLTRTAFVAFFAGWFYAGTFPNGQFRGAAQIWVPCAWGVIFGLALVANIGLRLALRRQGESGEGPIDGGATKQL